MTTVQQFLAWVREKSKKGRLSSHNVSFPSTTTLSCESTSVDPSVKPKQTEVIDPQTVVDESVSHCVNGLPRSPDLMEMLQRSGMSLQETEAFVNEVQRRAPFRASMKLPAIPREEQRTILSIRRTQQDSPSHVYEEIPAYAIDGGDDVNDSSNDDPNKVNMANLEFHKAKEFGPYLVVPIKNKLSRHVTFHHGMSHSQQYQEEIPLHRYHQHHQSLHHSLQHHNSHQDIMKRHQDTIEHHRQTVKQYREALPTPVCAVEDDPSVLGSDRLYPDDLSSSDSGFLSSSMHENYRTLDSQSSAFLPFRRSISQPGTNESGLPNFKNNIVVSDSAMSHSDGAKLEHEKSSDFHHRNLGLSKSFTISSKCNNKDLDNSPEQLNNGSHVHCKQCSRPHGMYHGTMISHDRVHHIDPADLDQVSLHDVRLAEYSHSTVVQADGNASAVIFHKGTALTRCNSSPAPLNLALTAPKEGSDNVDKNKLTVPTPHLKNNSSRILTNGSLNNSNRVIHNDTQTSPNSGGCNSAKSRLSMSSSDSGNSSIYAFSGSEKDGTLLRDKMKEVESVIEEKSEPNTVESDNSNDTFSEYDMNSRDSSPCVVSDEYSAFLSKVKHNHWFKIDVKRVIRESESSEYESTAELSTRRKSRSKDSDEISLTTVTSLSDVSVLDLEGASQNRSKRFSRSAAERRRVRFARNVTSDEDKSCDRSKSGKMESKKYVKRKNPKTVDKTELYCLPEFSSIYNDNEDIGDFDRLERLSCRATEIKPKTNTNTTTQEVTSPPTSPTSGLLNNYAATSRRDQNKLLSDLMKRNHDRQLFIL